jgi:hypothetical protein
MAVSLFFSKEGNDIKNSGVSDNVLLALKPIYKFIAEKINKIRKDHTGKRPPSIK